MSERASAPVGPLDTDLADCLDRYYQPSARVPVPPVRFRPVVDELDPALLRTALGSDRAVAYLRDCYRRLG
ncbi:hypothetical protein [Rhodococcus sp. X156]|uniref:hypothetical protein n=1 Tax=Rhodococcus sp. X156 TaxID=2499145 RepID=UPI000FDC920F|nr:hypothetical protein [Rhodococcus sp. X156]